MPETRIVRSLPFTVRLATVVIAVLVLASALTVVLNDLKFRRVMHDQAQGVSEFVAVTLRSGIEDSMNLGMKLAALENTQAMLQRQQRISSDITGISVTDAQGMILFDTDPSRIGRIWHPEAGPVQRSRAGTSLNSSGTWGTGLDGDSLVGARLTNSYGQYEGEVVVRASDRDIDLRAAAILRSMILAASLVTGLTSLVAVAVVYVLSREHRIWFARATAQIGQIGLDDGGSDATSPDLLDFVASAAETRAALEQARADLVTIGAGSAHAA
jgi:hypothetical protein